LQPKVLLFTAIFVLSLAQVAFAQNPTAALASLPEADAIIYISPQRILNEAAPRVMTPAELTKMRTSLASIKSTLGVDPATLEYLVIAVRFNKPATNLSFMAPDVLLVIGGDFSSDSLVELAQLALQDKARVEKYGSKSITLLKLDSLEAEALKTPMLKPYVELGAVPLSGNSFAIGNLRYIKSAVDAADGTGRINAATLESLFRDPNVLLAASGAPLGAVAKSLGLLGLENTSRESRCDTHFGNFYAAVTMSGTNFSLRGAMNADNPDTAKIVYNLFSGLMQEGKNAIPDKGVQTMLQSLKMSTRDNEVVWEADVPEKVVADFIRTAPKPEDILAPKPASTPSTPKRPVRKKRTRKT